MLLTGGFSRTVTSTGIAETPTAAPSVFTYPSVVPKAVLTSFQTIKVARSLPSSSVAPSDFALSILSAESGSSMPTPICVHEAAHFSIVVKVNFRAVII